MTSALFSCCYLLEGGKDELALEDTQKEFTAQSVPAQLCSNFQPEPRHEASGAAHPDKPIQGKASGPHTITTWESIMLTHEKLCVGKERKPWKHTATQTRFITQRNWRLADLGQIERLSRLRGSQCLRRVSLRTQEARGRWEDLQEVGDPP
jgi:hypothetical protein